MPADTFPEILTEPCLLLPLLGGVVSAVPVQLSICQYKELELKAKELQHLLSF